MTGFELTNKAKSDLKIIAIYTQNTWGKRQRNIYLTKLDNSFYALATNHNAGRSLQSRPKRLIFTVIQKVCVKHL